MRQRQASDVPHLDCVRSAEMGSRARHGLRGTSGGYGRRKDPIRPPGRAL